MSGSKASFKNRRQRGNAMVWSMLAAALAAIGVGWAFTAFRNSQRSGSVQEMVSEVGEIVSGVQANFGRYGYAGLTTTKAVNARVIPEHRAENLGTANASALNKFSGAITLVDNTATTARTALLTYVNVPEDQCVGIVTGTEGLVRAVSVAGVSVKALGGALDISALDTQCISGNGTVTIAWTVGST